MFSSIRGKVVLPILLVGFIFSVFGAFTIYKSIKEEYLSHVNVVLSLVSQSLGRSFSLSNDSVDWHRDTQVLRGYKGINHIYIVDKMNNKILSAGDESTIGRTFAKIHDDSIQKMIQSTFDLGEGEKVLNEEQKELRQTTLFDYTTKDGESSTACAYVSLDVESIYHDLYIVIRRTLGWFLMVTIAITIIVIALIYFVILKPIVKIGHVVKEQSEGDRSVRVPIHSKDEIHTFAESLNKMLDHLVDAEQREAQLAMVASNTGNAVLILGKNNKITWTNNGFTKIAGYEPEEIIGKSGEFIWGTAVNDYEVSQRIMENVLFRQAFREEIQIQKKNGAFIWVDIECTPYLDSEGTHGGMLLVATDINQAKLYKNQLQRKTELLSESEDAANIGSWDLDIERKKLSFSEQAYKIHGIPTNTELNHMHLSQYIVPDHRLEIINAIENATFNGVPWDLEVQIKRDDQRVIWVSHIGRVKKVGNKVVRLYGAVQNIDHIKRARIETEKRDHALRKLHEITTSLSLTLAEKFDQYLELGCDLFGMHYGALLKIQPDKSFIVEAAYDENNEMPKGFRFEPDQNFSSIAVEDPDPLLINEVEDTEYSIHLSYIQDDIESDIGVPIYVNGELYGTIGFWSEYPRNEFKDWENEMIRLFARRIQSLKSEVQNLDELKTMARRLELATDAAMIGVWDWNMDTNELIWDNSMFHVYGFNKTEITDLNTAWENSVHPDDLSVIQKAVKKSEETGQDLMCEFRIFWKDGSIRHLRSTGAVETNETGKHLIGVSWDVTSERQLKDYLIETKEAAEQASVAKSEFLKTISHELRTPLNHIIGIAGILEDANLNEEQREHLKMLEVSSQNLRYLINDLIDFSKIDSGKVVMEKVPCNVSHCIEESLDMLSQTLHYLLMRANVFGFVYNF
jgi:PAS domain S-box-containing protein